MVWNLMLGRLSTVLHSVVKALRSGVRKHGGVFFTKLGVLEC